MKHSLHILIGLLVYLFIFSAQTQAQVEFKEVPSKSFDSVDESSIAFADIDGDSDLDVLITGKNNFEQRIAKLYTNNGKGGYTESKFFEGVSFGSIAFADIDGDGDQDVLITGDSNSLKIAKLYTNDGSGLFTEVTGTPFEGVDNSSISFADIDSDNDQDVVITGSNNNNQRIAKLFTNDGSGGYTEVTGTPFEGVRYSSIAFADIDGDTDQDVLITGDNNNQQTIAKLYTNDGSGGYAEVTGTPFDGVRYSSIAFADIDGDSDQDVLITGDIGGLLRTKLYINDGSGVYTEETGTPFDDVYDGSVAFADIDGDSDQDVLITGENDGQQRISKMYTNDGSGGYTEVTGTSFDGVSIGSIAFADVDGDSDQDVLITGLTGDFGYSRRPISKLYTNDASGGYTEVMETPFDGVERSSIAFADIDGDSDQDVLITGENYDGQSIAKLYANDSNGGYFEVMGTPFEGVYDGSIAFADINGNSYKDVLITGKSDIGIIAKLYIRLEDVEFDLYDEVFKTSLEGVEQGSVAFTDIDGDSDQDVLITGLNNSRGNARLYTNNGSGDYTEVKGTPLEDVKYSSIAFADIDGDNDQDVLITGKNNNNQPIAKLYTNDGSGNYTEVTETPFEGVEDSSIAFADIDGDNDQDVLITGENAGDQPNAKLYTNDGNGSYTEVTETPFEGVFSSSIAFADIHGDSDQDVLITGRNKGGQRIAKLYTNDGSGGYTEVTETPFEGVDEGSIAFSDIDGDGDQDVLITGNNTTKLYINATPPPLCTQPVLPTLSVSPATVCNGDTATLDITGALNNATAWYVYTDSCGGTEIGTTATGTFELPEPITEATTFYIRGEGGCVTPAACRSITITPTELDDASFSYSAAEYFGSDADPAPTVTGLTGGIFSSTAGLSLNPTTGAIDISASTPGNYTVTYTTAGTCPNSSDVDLTINELDEAPSNSLHFDGNNDYVSSALPTVFNDITNNDFTMEAWIKPSGDTFSRVIFAQKNSNNFVSISLGSLNQIYVYVANITSAVTASGLLIDEWSHVACTWNASNSQIEIYINGILQSIEGGGASSWGNDNVMTIGARTDGSQFFSGELDEVRIWDTIRTPCQISSSMSSELTTLQANLVTYYKFNQGVAGETNTGIDVLNDFTTSYNGTLLNFNLTSNSSNWVLSEAGTTFNYNSASFCPNSSDPTPTIKGAIGGSFSSTAGLNLDTSTGAIDLGASTPGTYTVSYTTGGTCPNSLDANVTINALDNASFSYSEFVYLPTDTDPTPSITGLSGGSFSSRAGLSIDASTGVIDLSASTPGTYTVTYTTAGICPNSTEVTVAIVNCNLQASIQTSSVSCTAENDGALDLSIAGGTPPYTFLWSNGAVTEDINNLESGTYTVTITDNNWCEITAAATIIVEDTEDPVLDCVSDQTITLTSDQTDYTLPDYIANADVSATDNCDLSSISQTPVAGTVVSTGVHTISFTATDDSGNTTNCSFTLTVEETLGTTSADLGNINIYPNPTDQLVIINNAQQTEIKGMLVYDIQGKRVMQVELNSDASSIRLDVSQLASGTYAVVLNTENYQVTKRLIKK